MSQCVPNWDIDDDAPNPSHPRLNFLTAATASAAAATTPSGLDLSSIDYEVAELTWENGQLSMHGLGHSRLNSKPTATVGTLESLVNQATSVGNNTITPAGCKPSFACGVELVPGFDLSQNPTDVVATTSDTMTMDLLVPCTVPIGTGDPRRQPVWLVGNSVGHGTGVYGCCSTHVGSCSTMCGENRLQNPGEEEQRQEGNRKRTRCVGIDWGDHHSVSGSATYSHPFTQDTFMHERELENATSPGSPENMSCGEGRGKAAATTEEHDSVYSRPQKRESEEKRRLGKSSLSTRRSRAAAIHNQSERKRRDKINQKMKTLQKLVPNSSKTDKASVLDEVIDYLKQLQAQVQMMSRMNVPVPPMMLPLTMLQQQLQLSMMAPMGLGLGMAGMPAGVRAGDMSGLSGNRPNIPGIPPSPGVLHPFMAVAPWDSTPGDRFSAGPPSASVMPELLSAYLASQSSSPAMTLDAYSRLAAMYQQQIRQQQTSNPNN